jgi:hypothetical protein
MRVFAPALFDVVDIHVNEAGASAPMTSTA